MKHMPYEYWKKGEGIEWTELQLQIRYLPDRHFGKAMAAMGGNFGSDALKQLFVNFARSFYLTTGKPRIRGDH